MAGEWTDVCPECGAKLVPIFQPNTENLERVECMGDPKHAFPVIAAEGTDPPRYRLGDPVEPLTND